VLDNDDDDDARFNPKSFDGAFYAAIGDQLGERYLEYGFTKGTVAEVDFLVGALRLARGARILDVGCGVGRHSLELARRGYRVVGLDISNRFIQLAREAATRERLSAEFVVGDARDIRFQDEFDAAICLCEGAFGLAGSDEGNLAILRGIARALKPRSPFALTAINAYSVVRQGPPNYDLYTCASRESATIHNEAGEPREVQIYTSAFTFGELTLMLAMAGLDAEAGYGCEAGRFDRKPLTAGDTEVMVLARRPAAE
jgi:SAM-dependent methyltransferase